MVGGQDTTLCIYNRVLWLCARVSLSLEKFCQNGLVVFFWFFVGDERTWELGNLGARSFMSNPFSSTSVDCTFRPSYQHASTRNGSCFSTKCLGRLPEAVLTPAHLQSCRNNLWVLVLRLHALEEAARLHPLQCAQRHIWTIQHIKQLTLLPALPCKTQSHSTMQDKFTPSFGSNAGKRVKVHSLFYTFRHMVPRARGKVGPC